MPDTGPSERFDSLLAKVIGHASSGGCDAALQKTSRALSDFRIAGIETNIGFLQTLLRHPDVIRWDVHTRFVDSQIEALASAPRAESRFFDAIEDAPPADRAGASVDPNDPLAVLAYGKTEKLSPRGDAPASPRTDGAVPLNSSMQGTIVSVEVAVGDEVQQGDLLLVMEAMKMEHEIRAEIAAVVREITVSVGDTVYEGHPLVYIEERALGKAESGRTEGVDLERVRPILPKSSSATPSPLDDRRPRCGRQAPEDRPADRAGER